MLEFSIISFELLCKTFVVPNTSRIAHKRHIRGFFKIPWIQNSKNKINNEIKIYKEIFVVRGRDLMVV